MEKRKEGGQPGNKNAEKWTEEEAILLGNDLIEWIKQPTNFWVQEFLSSRGLYKDLTGYLENKFQSFLELKKEADAIQENKIVTKALKNEFNNTMSIFVLKNKHGYKDKTEVDSNVKVEYDGFLNDIKPPVD